MAKQQGTKLNRTRLLGVVVLILALIAGLFGRIIWIQTVHGEEYKQAIQEQQGSQQDSTIAALRGTIYDRNQNVLARSERVYDVIIDPKVLQAADTVTQQSTIRELCKILGIKDTSVLEKYLGAE